MDHTPGFLKLVDDARTRVHEIAVTDVPARVAAGARFFDVREDREWDAARPAGA